MVRYKCDETAFSGIYQWLHDKHSWVFKSMSNKESIRRTYRLMNEFMDSYKISRSGMDIEIDVQAKFIMFCNFMTLKKKQYEKDTSLSGLCK